MEDTMAKRRARRKEREGVVVITRADLARALRDISLWVQATRRIVLKLPPDTEIVIPKRPGQRDHRIDDGCPPPE
jgi:hypothetical protein